MYYVTRSLELISLQIGYNPLQGEGGFVMLVAAEKNEYECVKHMDFGVNIHD